MPCCMCSAPSRLSAFVTFRKGESRQYDLCGKHALGFSASIPCVKEVTIFSETENQLLVAMTEIHNLAAGNQYDPLYTIASIARQALEV